MKQANKKKKKSLAEKTRNIQIVTLIFASLSLLLSLVRVILERTK